MDDLKDYWSKITQSPSFENLDDSQKEKVRNHLFEKYVQTSDSYLNLPQSQRFSVKKHFDDVTQFEKETFLGGIKKKVGPAIEKGKQMLALAPAAEEALEPATMKAGYGALRKGAEAIRGAGEAAGTAIEPTEQEMIAHAKKSQEISAFDKARLYASGAVKTTADFLSGAIPTDYLQTAQYAAIDGVLRIAGNTFLGKWDILRNFKPKTGLSGSATGLNNDFEKIITRKLHEQKIRKGALAGPPQPLETLVRSEQTLKAQDELNQYEEWLKQADQVSASGGEPSGDLHPEAKVNVSQLRDAAKERLQKLQNEPVRVQSVQYAEDVLKEDFSHRIAKFPRPGEVIPLPSGPEAPRQELLPGGPQPAGLLESGAPKDTPGPSRTPTSPSKTPVTASKPPVSTPTPSFGETGIKGYKQYLSDGFSKRLPRESKQVIDKLSGSLLSALKGDWIHPTNPRPLTPEVGKMLDRVLDDTVRLHLEEKNVKSSPTISEEARLREKGLSVAEVRQEAERLKSEHDLDRQSKLERKNEFRQAIGRISPFDKDPTTGKVPEAEEYAGNVPLEFRGGTIRPDEAAQMAFDHHLISEPTTNALYAYMNGLESAGPAQSLKSFMDEAEYNLEGNQKRQAGFPTTPMEGQKPLIEETFSLGGEQAPEKGAPIQGAGQQGYIPGSEPTFPNRPVNDLEHHSNFNLLSSFFKEMGEKGGIGGEIDPVRQARMEALAEELVKRAMAMGYETTQDIMMFAAKNAPSELQAMLRKNLNPTLSPFDTHAYKEIEAAKQGNATAKKSLMDDAQRGYLAKKADIVKGVYRKLKANQAILIFKDGDESKMRLVNDLFIHDNYRKFSKDELAAMRWYIEGASPKLESLEALGVKRETAQKWLDLAKNPTENMKKARPMTQTFEDEYYDIASQFFDRMGYVEDHVTRRWKQDREYLDWEGRTLGNQPNFVKGRKLLSQAQGIDAGFEPVSWDIRDDLRASNNMRVNILSRIHAYQKLGASLGPDGMPAIIDESGDAVTQAKNAKITPHSGQAPNSWMRFEHVPMLKGLAINPYYKSAIKFMMARPFKGALPDTLDFLSASTKAAKLYGFFHGYTLGEMLASGISYRDVFSFSKNRNPMFKALRLAVDGMTADLEGKPLSKNPVRAIGELYHSFMSGSAMLANRPLALDMAEHGFKFGSADEDMHGILQKFLIKTEDFLKKRIGEGLAKGITALPRGAVDIQEKALWSYARPISSMMVYETNLADALEKNLGLPGGQRLPVDAIKSSVANQVSKEMGGISYARMMVDPKTQQILQWTMLAPGWTIGRGLMAGSVFEKGVEGNIARKQILKLFTMWFVTTDLINMYQTKKYLGKSRHFWENPEGYKDKAFLKSDPEKGPLYLQVSKALTEIGDDVFHPARTFSNKLSVPVQAAAKLMNWAKAPAYSGGREPEAPLKTFADMYKPMLLSGQSAYGGLPVRRGPSANKLKAMLDEYHTNHNGALLEEILQTATEQGLDASKLDRSVRGDIRRKERALLR